MQETGLVKTLSLLLEEPKSREKYLLITSFCPKDPFLSFIRNISNLKATWNIISASASNWDISLRLNHMTDEKINQNAIV